MSVDYFGIMKEYIIESLTKRALNVYIDKKKNFFGIKFSSVDRYFLCFLSYYENHITLTYRRNYHQSEVERVEINHASVTLAMEMIDKILDDNVNFPSDESIKIVEHEETDILKTSEKLANIKLTEIPYKMSPRLANCLARASIFTVSEFLKLSDEDLSNIKQLGTKSLMEAVVLRQKISSNNSCMQETVTLQSKTKSEIRLHDFFYKITRKQYNYECTDEDNERYVEFNNKIEEMLDVLLDKVCEKTNGRNAEIYRQRMELHTIEINTLRAIGGRFEISGERVRQIVRKITKKLKRYRSDFINLLNTCEEKYILNYFYDGICKVHSGAYLVTIFDIIGEQDICSTILSYRETIEQRLWQINNKVSAQNKLYSNIIFPQKDVYYPIEEFEKFEIERHVNENGYGKIGEYNLKDFDETIEYESFLEKRVITILDRAYYTKRIKTQSLKIDYIYNGVHRRYYPDIQVLTDKGQIVVIECKAIYEMGCTINLAKYDALKRFCEERGYGYLMTDEHHNTIDTIDKIEVPLDIENAFMELLSKNTKINYAMIKSFCAEHNLKLDFKMIMKLIIKYRDAITYSTRPFCISTKNKYLKNV